LNLSELAAQTLKDYTAQIKDSLYAQSQVVEKASIEFIKWHGVKIEIHLSSVHSNTGPLRLLKFLTITAASFTSGLASIIFSHTRGGGIIVPNINYTYNILSTTGLEVLNSNSKRVE
jgi:hypothetical protein